MSREKKWIAKKAVELSIRGLLIRHSGEVSKLLIVHNKALTGGMSNALCIVDLCK